MTNENEQERKKPLSLAGRGKLELKRPVGGDPGQASVRQSFPHGRSKTVTVEVKPKRRQTPEAAPKLETVEAAPAQSPTAQPAAGQQGRKPKMLGDLTAHELTEEERKARVRALKGAKRAEEDAQLQAEAETHRRVEEEAEARRDADAAPGDEASGAAGQAPQPHAPPVIRDTQGPARIATAAELAAQKAKGAPQREEEEEEVARRRPGQVIPKRPAPVKRNEPRRRMGAKMTVTQALGDEDSERTRSLASVRRARERERLRMQTRGQEKVLREVVIP